MRDKELIKLLQAGNETEVDQIILENYTFVYAYLYRRCANSDVAKELTQETFYRFFKNIHSYEAKGKLLNYLYRIALHLFYDEARKRKQIYEDYDMEQIADETAGAKEQLEKEQNRRDVRAVLAKLPPSHQDILIFRFYQELKFKDIAAITAMPVSTVKSRYKAAIQMMEHYWKEGEVK